MRRTLPEGSAAVPPNPNGERVFWLSFRQAMYLLPQTQDFLFSPPGDEQTGAPPNYGHQMNSAVLRYPVAVPGVRDLLVTTSLLPVLPPGARPRLLVSNPQGEVYLVPVDPAVPLELGARGEISFRPAEGGGG